MLFCPLGFFGGGAAGVVALTAMRPLIVSGLDRGHDPALATASSEGNLGQSPRARTTTVHMCRRSGPCRDATRATVSFARRATTAVRAVVVCKPRENSLVAAIALAALHFAR